MGLYAGNVPWLSKPAAASAAAEAIARSATAARAELGHADTLSGRTRVLAPGAVAPKHVLERVRGGAHDAPEGSLDRTLAQLPKHRAELPQGSFVFVISDFLAPVRATTWSRLRAARWDVVPVVVQDPTWEQSFPPIARVLVPFASANAEERGDVRLGAAETGRLKNEHEQRLAALLLGFRSLEFDPVVLGTADPAAVLAAFLRWAERRRARRRHR